MNEIIAIILTFLAGLGALAGIWSKIRAVLVAAKESLDVASSARDLIQRVQEAEADKVWTNEEIQAIRDAAIEIGVQFDEAKDAIGQLGNIFGKKLKQ